MRKLNSLEERAGFIRASAASVKHPMTNKTFFHISEKESKTSPSRGLIGEKVWKGESETSILEEKKTWYVLKSV